MSGESLRVLSSSQVQNAGEGSGGALSVKEVTFSRRWSAERVVDSGMKAVGTERSALSWYFSSRGKMRWKKSK